MYAKVFQKFCLWLGICFFGGSIFSSCQSEVSDVDGDGISNRQTLTANLLGYERYADCYDGGPVPSGNWWCPLGSVIRVATDTPIEDDLIDRPLARTYFITFQYSVREWLDIKRNQKETDPYSGLGAFLATYIGVWFELLLGMGLMLPTLVSVYRREKVTFQQEQPQLE